MKYLKLKKTSPERRRKKMKEGTRVASNERRLIREKSSPVIKIHFVKKINDKMNESYQMTFLASIKIKGKFCDGPV